MVTQLNYDLEVKTPYQTKSDNEFTQECTHDLFR